MSKKIKRHYDCYARMADELRSERLLKRITQQQVADALGCSRRTVGNIEDYSVKPSPEQLRKLSEFFGRPEDYFSNLIDKETEEPETVYPETKEQLHAEDGESSYCYVAGSEKHKEHIRNAMRFFLQFALLKDEAKERLVGAVADALANPANIKGCEFCSGRDE